jgi:hypothetical protein
LLRLSLTHASLSLTHAWLLKCFGNGDAVRLRLLLRAVDAVEDGLCH